MKRHFTILLSLVVLALLIPSQSYAIYDGVRDTSYSSSDNRCDTGTIDFDPFSLNRDIDWQLTNPICIAYVASFGVALKAAAVAGAIACSNPGQATAAAAGAAVAPLGPWTMVVNTFLAAQCVATAASPAGPPCCTGAVSSTVATLAAVGGLATIWAASKFTYEHASICGRKWSKWEQDSNGDWSKSKGDYQLCLQDLFLDTSYTTSTSSCQDKYLPDSEISDMKVTNRAYREFIYGGMEYKDNECSNPSTWDSAKRLQVLGYDDDNQRYYMTGPGSAPVFACYRFLTLGYDVEAQSAYDCCKDRSQEAICIENKSGLSGASAGEEEYKFCEIGSKCQVGDTVFEIYESTKQVNYACARTYNVCPYNHLLGGGTEAQKYSDADSTQLKNFCQFMNHCQKLPILPYVRTSNFEGAFVSSACYDMRGDSQNVYGYTSQLIPINTRGFSAPLVQCFKETMENVFLHKAGRSVCSDPNEFPDADGICASGNYYVREGFYLSGDSFFVKIRDGLQDAIRMALSLSVMFFGVMILLGMQPIEKKQILTYIAKIGIVMYFALGNGWYFGFMTGVLNASTFLADIGFKVDESGDDDELDGCQFPRYDYADDNEETKYDNPVYPAGKEYLRVWDTLDCKIARALGFGPEVSVPNLIFMILGGFLTGGLGIVFVVAAFCFAFFLISIVIRAIHIFLLSMTTVIILLYVSPITITLFLFNKTKSIFDGWWKRLLSVTLQPMILCVYLGIFISIFDSMVIGDITFTGEGQQSPKRIVCDGEAADTSIYCIFRIADVKTWHGLELIGIGLPILGSLDSTALGAIMKAAILMFIFTHFMDQISNLSEALLGSALSSDWKISAGKMAAKSYGTLNAIRERAQRGAIKHGGKAAGSVAESIRSGMQNMGNKGKGVSDASANLGSHAGSTDKMGSGAGDHSGNTDIGKKESLPSGADRAGSTESTNPGGTSHTGKS